MPPPAKRRKLSHKQIIRLLEGLVPTVGENHFEKFFSENYRPEVGEGKLKNHNLQIRDNIVLLNFQVRYLQDSHCQKLNNQKSRMKILQIMRVNQIMTLQKKMTKIWKKTTLMAI